MNSTTALPPKAAQSICSECGLIASAPIVVALGVKNSGDKGAQHQLGRCANRKACDLRVLRKLNREKEAKA